MGGALDPGGGNVDGFTVAYVPDEAGDLVSDYSTEWGGVRFESRVWEHETDEGGFRVDLKVNVLRGERLTGVEALREFIADYEEQDPGAWELERFQNGQWQGYRTEGLAFWFVGKGVGVSVRLDPRAFDDEQLTLTARGIRPGD